MSHGDECPCSNFQQRDAADEQFRAARLRIHVQRMVDEYVARRGEVSGVWLSGHIYEIRRAL